MNEDDIKTLRQSFSNPYREDLPKPKKNKFGHTILSDSVLDEDPVEIDVEIDSNGTVTANPSQTLMNSPHMIDMLQKFHKIEPYSEVLTKSDSTPSEPKIIPNKVQFAALLSELDEMDGTSKKTDSHLSSDVKLTEDLKPKNEFLKACSNKDCLYNLPKDAKFCLECGTAQMPKFCTECGYSFPGMEKFCPDCGNKR